MLYKNFQKGIGLRSTAGLTVGFIFAFAFLLAPEPTHAESCLGSVDSAKYVENYLKTQRVETAVDVNKLIAQTLNIKSGGTVSLGDAIGVIVASNKAILCFTSKDYSQGLKTLGGQATKIAMDKIAGIATGYSLVTLPANVVELGIEIFKNAVNKIALNSISENYMLAMERCEGGKSRDSCHNRIVECSALSTAKTIHEPRVCFESDGYLFSDGWLIYPRTTEQSFKQPEFPFERKFFYEGAGIIYEKKKSIDTTETIKQNEQIANSLIDDAIKSAAAVSDGGKGFFSNLWKKIVNLFTKSDKNADLPVQKEESTIQPSDLSGQISDAIPNKQETEKSTKPNPFQAIYDLLERGGKLQSCVKNKLGDKFTAAYNGEYVSPEMETGWRECARSVAGQFTEDAAYIVEMPTLRQCMQNTIGSAIDLSRVLADPASIAKLEKLVSENPEIQKKMEACFGNLAFVYAAFEKYVRGNQTPPAETKIPAPQQPTPTIQTSAALTYKVSCDRNLGSSPFPAVSLEWNINQSKVTSQILYRNGDTLVELPASGGNSYFDGTVKVGETYTYVIKMEYKDGSSESAKAVVTISADTCL